MTKDFKDIGDKLADIIRDVSNASGVDHRALSLTITRTGAQQFRFEGRAQDQDTGKWRDIDFRLDY